MILLLYLENHFWVLNESSESSFLLFCNFGQQLLQNILCMCVSQGTVFWLSEFQLRANEWRECFLWLRLRTDYFLLEWQARTSAFLLTAYWITTYEEEPPELSKLNLLQLLYYRGEKGSVSSPYLILFIGRN